MESKKCNGSPYAWKGQDNYLSAAINDGCGQNKFAVRSRR